MNGNAPVPSSGICSTRVCQETWFLPSLSVSFAVANLVNRPTSVARRFNSSAQTICILRCLKSSSVWPWRSDITILPPGFNKLASLRIERARALCEICIHTALNKIKSKLTSCLVITLNDGNASLSHFTFKSLVTLAPNSASSVAGSTAKT